jgi:hypothetical protein
MPSAHSSGSPPPSNGVGVTVGECVGTPVGVKTAVFVEVGVIVGVEVGVSVGVSVGVLDVGGRHCPVELVHEPPSAKIGVPGKD